LAGSSDEEEESNIDRLLHATTILRNKNRKLEEMVVELKMDNIDLEDSFRNMRISTTTKLKSFAHAIGREDILKPPSP